MVKYKQFYSCFCLLSYVFPHTIPTPLKTGILGDTWVAQSLGHPTLDFGVGLDLGIVSLRPMLGSMLGADPT